MAVFAAAGAQIRNVQLASGAAIDGGCDPLPGVITASVALAPAAIASLTVETVLHALKHPTGVRLAMHRPADPGNPCVAQSQATNSFNILPESGLSSNGATVFMPEHSNEAVILNDILNLSVAHTEIVGVNARTLPINSALGKLYGSGNVKVGMVGQVFDLNATSGVTEWVFPGSGPSIGLVGSVAIGQGNLLCFGSSQPLVLNRLQSNSSGRITAPTIGMVEGTPVVGNGNIIYAATNAGAVQAFDGNLSELWRMPQITNAIFDTSPTIDCARDSAGTLKSGPGTLYVAGTGTGALYALIVDSKGLDRSAPWPKFQHDTRNTGYSGPATGGTVCP